MEVDGVDRVNFTAAGAENRFKPFNIQNWHGRVWHTVPLGRCFPVIFVAGLISRPPVAILLTNFSLVDQWAFSN
jgi:hypothetical protein